MKKITFTLMMLFAGSQVLYSQGILDRINNKINVNININSNESGTQNNHTQNNTSNQNNADSSAPTLNFPGMGGKSKCKVEPSYVFQTEIIMDVYSFDASGKNKSKDSFSLNYSMLFEKNAQYIGTIMHKMSNQTDMDEMKTVMNLKDSCYVTFMINDGNKMGMSMSFKNIQQYQKKDKEYSDLKFTKTGKTKTILGHLCYEYIAENEETKMTQWVSEKETMIWDAYIKNGYTSIPNSNIRGMEIGKNGMPLETVVEDKKKKTIMYMYVREIKQNQNIVISSEGYTIY